MRAKFIIKKVYIRDTSLSSSIVEDYYTIENKCSPFFKYELIFDSYLYQKIFDSKINNYQKVVSSRVYHLVLSLDLEAIANDRSNTKSLYPKLQAFFTYIQIREFSIGHKYQTSENNIGSYITYRKQNPMYVIPWTQFRINSSYVFDLKRKRLLRASSVERITFGRTGGIIESNNVGKLIREHFFGLCRQNTLVILPAKMLNLWSGIPTVTCITFDQLLNKNFVALIKKPDLMIIHEGHSPFFFIIKCLIRKLGCKHIWIINSLPLCYYLPSQDKTINIKSLMRLSNIWMNFDLEQKKFYRTEIYRMLITKFNQFYTQVHYHGVVPRKYHFLKLSAFETNIYGEFNKSYFNWKEKLTNDRDNIYSVATKRKCKKIERAIFQSVLSLITSSGKNSSNAREIFKNKFKKSFLKVGPGEKEVREMDTTCGICYDPPKILTYLACGHTFCLECTLKTLAISNQCPFCRQPMNVQRTCIIGESISSNIRSYLSNLDPDTLIVTNLESLENITCNPEYQAQIINVDSPDVSYKIRHMSRVRRLVLITFPNKLLKKRSEVELEKILGYISLFNDQPHVLSVKITSSDLEL